MVESIGTTFTTAVKPYVTLYLAEAEAEDYPYAVYEHTLTNHYTKEGVYKITADTQLHIYGKDLATLDTISANAQAAISAAMSGGQYLSRLRTVNKDCTEGIWELTLGYSITQLY